MDYDAFISYRRSSKELARSIKEALTVRGLSVFIDLDELKDGHYLDVIYSAIDKASVFILILSNDIFDRCYIEDDSVRVEIEHALNAGKVIIPINPDRQFQEFPSDVPEFIRENISKIQFSAIDTEQLFSASIDKMVKERIQPLLKTTKIPTNNTRTRSWRSVCFLVVALVVVSVVCGVFLQHRSLYDSDPRIQIDKADAKARIPVYETKSIEGERKGVVKSYRDAAIRCDHEGNNTIVIYGGGDFDTIDDAQDYFQCAGYAWQCVEEYEKSIKSFMNAIRITNMILQEYPEEADYAIDHKSFYLNNIAYSYAGIGEMEKAINALDEALSLRPETLNYHDSKGEIYFLFGQYDKALEEWEYIQDHDKYYERNEWVDKSKEMIK